MMTGTTWQDLIAVLATLTAGAWLLRRWIVKRRTKAGCDTCAAAFIKAQPRRPPGEAAPR